MDASIQLTLFGKRIQDFVLRASENSISNLTGLIKALVLKCGLGRPITGPFYSIFFFSISMFSTP